MDDSECALCHSKLKCPARLTCGHVFCDACIRYKPPKKNKGDGHSCPQCGDSITESKQQQWEYNVVEISDTKGRGRSIKYLTHFEDKSTMWLPKASLDCPDKLAEFKKHLNRVNSFNLYQRQKKKKKDDK